MTSTISQPEQPGTSVLAALFQHNAWATTTLLDFCEGLSPEQLAETSVGTFGSIRDTLYHLVFGEVSYVVRVHGKRPEEPFPEDFFAVLRKMAAWTGEELLQLALSARSDTLVHDGTERYKLADLMVQALTHSTEHRTQVSTIITLLGLEPPDLSGWRWLVDKGDWSDEAAE